MLKIIQITDIHIGGDYNGKFDVKGNFEKVLTAIKKHTFDLLVLTGDIADNNYLKNYQYVKDTLSKYLPNINYIVLGGNHDNMRILYSVFSNNSNIEKVHNVTFPECCISFVDTSDGTLKDNFIEKIEGKIVFTHYPLAHILHNFMSSFRLKNEDHVADMLFNRGVRDVFCGHFHNDDYVESNINIHLTPSTQCQIDKYSDKFKVSSYAPGYREIHIDNGGLISNDIVRYII